MPELSPEHARAVKAYRYLRSRYLAGKADDAAYDTARAAYMQAMDAVDVLTHPPLPLAPGMPANTV